MLDAALHLPSAHFDKKIRLTLEVPVSAYRLLYNSTIDRVSVFLMGSDHLELTVELPHDPHTLLHIHLTLLSTSTMVFITSKAPGESGTSSSAMGSLIYAMPLVSFTVCG